MISRCAGQLLIWLFLLYGGYAAAEQETVYTFGVPPQQTPADTAKRWIPLTQYLSRKTGVIIQFQTARDLATFHAQLKRGLFDFAFSSPQTYIEAHHLASYKAFAKERGGSTVGLIVVRNDSAIQDVKQLNQLTLAFAGPTAFTATTLPRTYLKQQGVEINLQYIASIDSVYRAVAKGTFQAGGGEARTFGALDPELKNELRVLWASKSLPPFAFAARAQVPPDIVARVREAMLDMHLNAAGRGILRTLNFKAFEGAADADYDVVRQMHFVHDGATNSATPN